MGAFIHDYYLEKRRSRQFAIKSTTFMSQRVAEHEFKLKLGESKQSFLFYIDTIGVITKKLN